MMRRLRPRPRRANGFTMVELLVGCAIGLVAAACAASVVAAHAAESRRQTIEARLIHELRATSDLVLRDLRRAGYWSAAASGVRDETGRAALANPHGAVFPEAAASDAARLSFARDGFPQPDVDDSELFGFRLRNGAVELQLGVGNWQALNDAQTLAVTSFTIEPRTDEVSLDAFCAADCRPGSTLCPPRQQVRSFVVTIAARATADARVARLQRGIVRTRNDRVVGSCEG